MPIICPHPIRDLMLAEFDERDAAVMRCAYHSQNILGRLCDERVYENDLALRLKAAGLREVLTQVPVTVCNHTFSKRYYLDLVADGALYELKTVSVLTGDHDAQILHYSMLCGVRHGKLLNFRNERVEGRLRFNALTTVERQKVVYDESRWEVLCDGCEPLKQRLRELVEDWGAYLAVQLYEEALIHHCGGTSSCLARLPLVRDGFTLGTHTCKLLGFDVGFHVTAFSGDTWKQQRHIERLLRLTPLRRLQWINFNRATIELVTLRR